MTPGLLLKVLRHLLPIVIFRGRWVNQTYTYTKFDEQKQLLSQNQR